MPSNTKSTKGSPPAKKPASKKSVASKDAALKESTQKPSMKEDPNTVSCLRREVAPDGVCVLTFDDPASSANVLRESVLNELSEHLDWIEKQNHHKLRALVIESAKDSIFIAGADVQALYELSPEHLDRLLQLGQRVFNRLADISIPTVAVIHGACMGGGLELALACDYRVATADKSTKIGLPEVLLGILPAWGGSTRMPRLIGLPKALNLILTGKKLTASAAKKLGVIDAIAPREYLHNSARDLLQHGKPDKKSHWLLNNRLTGKVLQTYLRPQLLKKTRGNYPAPLKILEVVTEAAHSSRDHSLDLERRGVLKLARDPACANLIRTFLLQQRARKLKHAPANGFVPKPVTTSAVIGAGVMGAGIAHWLSSRKLNVILEDIGPEQIANGLSLVSKRYAEAVKRRIFTKNEALRLQDNIAPTAQPVPLAGIDLVIEAATENMEIKKAIFRKLEARAGKDTVLATNTSALPIEEITTELKHPERIIGIHFFNPVHRMQLVEVVVPEKTAPEAVASTLAFVKGIGKLPVVVSDTPGFLVNRVLMPYLIEAGHLYAQGVDAKTIDKAMLDFGMPMGPIRLLDEIGLDVALDVAQTLSAAFPDRMDIPKILEEMVEQKHLGKKSGRGFYEYENGKSKDPTPTTSQDTVTFSSSDLQKRMAFLMINEAARCLDEAVAAAPEDVDFAMIMGTGFAPFRGGPLRYADHVGIPEIVPFLRDCEDATAAVNRFHPCDRLLAMTEKNETFYSEE